MGCAPPPKQAHAQVAPAPPPPPPPAAAAPVAAPAAGPAAAVPTTVFSNAVPDGNAFTKKAPGAGGPGQVRGLICSLVYDGTPKPLSCNIDSDNIRECVEACGISDVTLLHEAACTPDALKGAIAAIGGRCGPDDVFVFYFAGHGVSVTDQDKDEKDGKDEAFMLLTAPGQMVSFTDDQLSAAITSSVPAATRVLIMTDCCHSGSIADLGRKSWSGREAVALAGCVDSQESGDIGVGGIFTHSMLAALQKLNAAGQRDVSVGKIFNETLLEDDRIFRSAQKISCSVVTGFSPDKMAWPLVLKEGSAYVAPIVAATAAAMKAAGRGLSTETLRGVANSDDRGAAIQSVPAPPVKSDEVGCARMGAACVLDGRPIRENSQGGAALLIVCPQNDFQDGNTPGALAVPGATQDFLRIAELIEKLGDSIERVVVVLDSRHRMHISHASFWVGADDSQPGLSTVITVADIKEKKWKAKQAEMEAWTLEYAERLEAAGRPGIQILPDHCLIGSPGHAVCPPVASALSAWETKKSLSVTWVLKGQNTRTEMHSAFKADVELENDISSRINTDLVQALAGHTKVVCCGEALSHSVNYTVRDLLANWPTGQSKDKIIVVEDGASPLPGSEEAAKNFLEHMKVAGATVCKAQDVAL